MPVHIKDVTSDVTVTEGDLPLTEEQIEHLVRLVMARQERKEREARTRRESTQIRRRSARPYRLGE